MRGHETVPPEGDRQVLLEAAEKLIALSELYRDPGESEYRQGIRDAAGQLRSWANG